jgi:multiple sugar transport system ATP-binding protein
MAGSPHDEFPPFLDRSKGAHSESSQSGGELVIRLDHITKEYAKDQAVVDDLSLDIEDGEFMVLVGPSGSGKSTVVRMVAGLTRVTRGNIYIGDREVTRLPPQERDVAMVFQNYALYPHMSVRRNLEFGLRTHKVPRAEVASRVTSVARMLHLDSLLERRPGALSGGERQRVAMGRAIVREPKAFLLDEPLSNLDAKLRVEMRAEILQLRDRLRTTTIYVTHDQVEAMTLGDRVAVLHKGTLQQVDTGRALYERPLNLFVASFIGSPPMNIAYCERDGQTLKMGAIPVPAFGCTGVKSSRNVIIGIRPTAIQLRRHAEHSAWPAFRARVLGLEELGSERILIFDLADARPIPPSPDMRSQLAGENGRTASRFQARVAADAEARLGEPVDLTFDPAAVYYFDAESHNTIRFPGME